jgi:hypothetical protein
VLRLENKGYPKNMGASISDIRKKRGRPSTGGRKPGVMVRMSFEDLADIDAWISARADKVTRPEAIRQLALAKARADLDGRD